MFDNYLLSIAFSIALCSIRHHFRIAVDIKNRFSDVISNILF
jgi:hypothetical protein